jgi:hypothetical protein
MPTAYMLYNATVAKEDKALPTHREPESRRAGVAQKSLCLLGFVGKFQRE